MNGFLKISGNYQDWTVYRKSVIISDITEMFINRYLPQDSRTRDQMRQAARSCKQNIVEGVSDGTVSLDFCIRLLGIARGSARELREDYGDYIRQHKGEIWSKDDYRIIRLRNYSKAHYDPADYVARCEKCDPISIANIALTLLYQIDSLLAMVLKDVEQEFIKTGGLRETMSKTRRQNRGY